MPLETQVFDRGHRFALTMAPTFGVVSLLSGAMGRVAALGDFARVLSCFILC